MFVVGLPLVSCSVMRRFHLVCSSPVPVIVMFVVVVVVLKVVRFPRGEVIVRFPWIVSWPSVMFSWFMSVIVELWFIVRVLRLVSVLMVRFPCVSVRFSLLG